MAKPQTMVATYSCACARELISVTKRKLGKFQPFKNNPTPAIQSSPPVKSSNVATKVKKEATTIQKRLTPAQVEEYRRKNLCFKCDELYTYGHKCKETEV